MKTIQRAYDNYPLLTAVTIAVVVLASIAALIAFGLHLPNLINNPMEAPTQTAVDLLQALSLLMLVITSLAVYVDRKAINTPKQDLYADFFGRSPRQRNRLTLTLGWERINRNGQVNRRMMAMAI